MCGIAGLVCFKAGCTEEAHTSVVRRMCEVQRHRGPDDEGIVSLDNVCLGAARLSIIDLTDAGRMPMADVKERWWISYNGEVYNFNDLREELLRCGHVFRSRTDTEVVLHAFAEWGEKCLDRLVGMFAFAVYDQEMGTVTLVRDRFGKKPLYYTHRDGHVLFASEMKALLQVSDRLRVDRERLIEWSLYRNVDVLAPETLIEDIYSVLPGHLVTIRQGSVTDRCYYSPTSQVSQDRYERFARQPREIVLSELEAAIKRSVEARLISDVPVGTLCSGGLDSSLITAMAARERKDIVAFHVSVAGYPALDERQYADQVTKKLGVELVSHPLTGQTFRRELVRATYFSDAPLTHPNSVAFLQICQVARARGVIVLLSGEGADELFGGYAWRYRRHRSFLKARRLLGLLPRKLRRGIELAGYVSSGIQGTSYYLHELLPHTVSFIDRYARREWHSSCEDAYGFVSNPSDRAVLGAMLGDLADFLTPLLRRLDRMSMGASTECRVPFLDHRLVAQVVNLPLSLRVNRMSDKWALKRIATRYLPLKLVQRTKRGFPLPLADYLAPLARTELFAGGFCQDVMGLRPIGIRDVVANVDQSVQPFFNLLGLEIWGRLFILRQPLDQVDDLLLKTEYDHAKSRRAH